MSTMFQRSPPNPRMPVASVLFMGLYASLAAAEAPYTIAYASLGWIKPNIFIADADGNNVSPLAIPDRDYSPSFSKDGSWIVFTSERGGSADIYRIHRDGSGLERLTNDPAFDDQGVLSPDGKLLAFVSTRSGRANIWLLDLASKKLKNLTPGSSGDFRPAWSPDGQQIAFSSDRESPHKKVNAFFAPLATGVYVMDRDGSGVRRISNGPNSAGSPAWSPKGNEIVCLEKELTAGAAVLVAIDPATKQRRVLADSPGPKGSPHWLLSGGVVYLTPAGVQRTDGQAGSKGNFGPTPAVIMSTADWSPDQKMMVFSREAGSWPPFESRPTLDTRFQLLRTGIFPSFAPAGDRFISNSSPISGAAHNSILLMNADGSNRSVLFDDPMRNALAPEWSHRGDRIAFALGEFVQSLPQNENRTSQLALIRADGKDLQLLPAAGDHAGYPSWSPDDTRLVYVTFGKRGLHILDLRDGRVTDLHTGADDFPSWSPLGDWIAFTSSFEGDYEIYKIRPDGTGLTRLTHSPGNDGHSKWSPDGRWIAFASSRSGFKDETGGMSDGEIYVMRADGSDVRKLTDNTFEDGTPAWAPRKPPPPPKRRANRGTGGI